MVFCSLTVSFKKTEMFILSVVFSIVLEKVALAMIENSTMVSVITIIAMAPILSQELRTKFIHPVRMIRRSVTIRRLNKAHPLIGVHPMKQLANSN